MIPRRIRSSNAAAAFGAERVVTKVELNPRFADSDFAVPPPPRPDYTFLTRAGRVVLPFQFVNNHIYADVRLNGRTFSMLVDTGAANVMTPTTARLLGLKPVGDARVWGAGDFSEAAAFARVNAVAIGGVQLRNQLFAVVPLESLSDIEGVPFHGMIGYELFKRFIGKIDYEARMLSLMDPAAWNPAGAGIAVPFVFNGTVPEIEGDIDGIPATFDIDTGSRMSVGLHSPFVLKHGLRARFQPSIETVTGWGLGGPSRGTVARVKRLRLGPIPINDVVVDMSRQTQGVLSYAVPAGNIGSGLLRRFTVTLDYPRQRIHFAPNARTNTPDSYDRAGLWINREGNAFKVAAVVDRSPAARAGVVEGDVITAVDGVRSATIALGELRERWTEQSPGTEVKLTLRRENKERLVAFRLRDLF
jgi:hypothetical protein